VPSSWRSQITQCVVQPASSYLEEARARVLEWTASFEAYRLPAAVRDAIDTSVMHATELARKYVTEGLGSVVVQVLSHLSRFMLISIHAFFLLKMSAACRAITWRAFPRERWRSRA
jgi:hypothetical protein